MTNYGYAYEAAETMLSHVGDVDLADIPQMEPVGSELLKTAQLQFQNLLKQRSNDPEILLLEGRTRARLGDVLEMIGQYSEAETNYRSAIQSLQDLEQRAPGDGPVRAEPAPSTGWAFCSASSTDSVRPRRISAKPSSFATTLQPRPRPIARSHKPESDSRYHLGALLARLANPKAEDKKLYDRAIKDQETLLSLDPGEPENKIKLARYLNNLAVLETRTDPAKAEKSLRRALDLLAGLNSAPGQLARRPLARSACLQQPGKAPERKGRKDEAQTILGQARDVLTRLTAEFPRIDQYRRELASIFNNLGRVGRNTQDDKLALESFRQSAEQLKGLAQKSPQVPDFRQNRDVALFQLGLLKAETDLAAGEHELTPLLADQESLISTYPSVPDYRIALGRNLLEYGKLLLRKGESDRASPLLDKALARFERRSRKIPGTRATAGT